MITPAAIKAAQVGERLADGTVPGLSLLVVSEKRKSWYLYYRFAGRERRPKLGDYPKPLGIKEARAMAKDYLHDVCHGKDPVAEKKALKDAPDWPAWRKRYLEDHATGKKTEDEDIRMLDSYVEPKWRKKRVAEITYDDVYELHRGLKDKPYQANRVLALVSKMLNLAERWQWRPFNSNPCRHVERFPERKRRRYLSVDEASAISTELDRHAKRDPAGVAFIYLLILTGARKGEIAGATWDMIKDGRLVLDVHKTDSDGEARVIHLPQPVLDVLAQLPRVTGATITGIKDPHKLWETVRRKAGCPDLRLHDLRHSFASAALAAGYTLHQIGELLGHKSAQTTKRYAHLVDELEAEAATTTAERIAASLNRAPLVEGAGARVAKVAGAE
jgi:integrase